MATLGKIHRGKSKTSDHFQLINQKALQQLLQR